MLVQNTSTKRHQQVVRLRYSQQHLPIIEKMLRRISLDPCRLKEGHYALQRFALGEYLLQAYRPPIGYIGYKASDAVQFLLSFFKK